MKKKGKARKGDDKAEAWSTVPFDFSFADTMRQYEADFEEPEYFDPDLHAEWCRELRESCGRGDEVACEKFREECEK
ncbi:hypothetical protein [Thermofilum pendens]